MPVICIGPRGVPMEFCIIRRIDLSITKMVTPLRKDILFFLSLVFLVYLPMKPFFVA